MRLILSATAVAIAVTWASIAAAAPAAMTVINGGDAAGIIVPVSTCTWVKNCHTIQHGRRTICIRRRSCS